MLNNIKSVITKAYHILLPESCILCDEPDTNLCAACIKGLPRSYESGSSQSRAFLNYRNYNVRKLLHHIKYYNQPFLAHKILDYAYLDIQLFIESHTLTDFVIIPIPADSSRALARGYNQAAIIAKYVSSLLSSHNIRHTYSEALVRTRHTKRLSHLTGGIEDRKAALKGIYKVLGSHSSDDTSAEIAGKDILLLDDITTSGSTYYEAKEALIHSGASRVLCYSLAH